MCSVALLSAACAIPRTESVSRLGSAPVVSGGTYTSGGGLSVAVELRDAGGLTQVCGVWALSRQQSALTKLAEHQVLGSGSVHLGRERILSNLLFLRRVDPSPDYAGQEANCTRTARAWQPGDAARRPEIHIPQQVVANESENGLGFGGPVVWFRQTGPGAGDS